MKPLLFIAADPRECTGWIRHWDRSTPARLPVHWAREGLWQGRSVIAIANGAGPARAAQAVAASAFPAAVCSIGFCGALDPALRIGDVFIATAVRSGARTWPALRLRSPEAASGLLISQARIAATATEKAALLNSGGSVVEMEAAAVARASEELSVPFYCIRAVSDLANESFANNFEKALKPDGRFSVPRLILGALANPIPRFAELIRLSRRTSLASNNLGAFLASCNF